MNLIFSSSRLLTEFIFSLFFFQFYLDKYTVHLTNTPFMVQGPPNNKKAYVRIVILETDSLPAAISFKISWLYEIALVLQPTID